VSTSRTPFFQACEKSIGMRPSLKKSLRAVASRVPIPLL
jgi:hypothetical protein